MGCGVCGEGSVAPCGAGIPSLGFAYPVVARAIRCADGLVLT